MDRCASMTRLPATTLPATVSGGAPKRAFAGWRALIVSSHPNRSRRVTPAANPTPEQIRSARDAAGLTQTEAARLIHCTLRGWQRSEEHTSELQSLMRISYAVFCLKKKKK